MDHPMVIEIERRGYPLQSPFAIGIYEEEEESEDCPEEDEE